MNVIKRFLACSAALLAIGLFATAPIALAGCEEDAGEEVGEAVDEMGDEMEDAVD